MITDFGVASPLRPARLTVGIASAGRVGRVLGCALEKRGHVVRYAVARAPNTIAAATTCFADAIVTSDIAEVAGAELIILAVPDAALPEVVDALVRTGRIERTHIIVHTAGAFGVQVLRPLTDLGALTIAAHPAQTFSGGSEDSLRLQDCPWAITASDEVALAVGHMLVLETQGRPMVVDEKNRALYHAALAHGANHLNTLVCDAVETLNAAIQLTSDDLAGVPAVEPRQAASFIAPLLHAALENALNSGRKTLTGPVVRGDVVTVANHLDQLEALDADLSESYRALALRTAHCVNASADMTDLLAPHVQEISL